MQENKRAFRGIWIPSELWLDATLSTTQKVLIAEIDSLDNEDGCFATNGYFAKFLNCDKVYASQLISKLKELEWVYEESFNGRRRVLRSNLKKIYGARVIVTAPQEPTPGAKENALAIAEPMLVLRELDGFLEIWRDFKEHRVALRAKMTNKAEALIMADLLQYHKKGINVVEAIRQSITSGWKKPYPKVGGGDSKVNGRNPEKISNEGFGNLEM